MTSIIKVDTIQTSAGGTPTASSLGIGGVGKIGQVVNTSNAMSTTTITSTSSVAISGFTATITPSATSSKIFVLATYSYTQDGYNNGTLAFSQIYRGLMEVLA
jgi:hypothetical protein